MVYNTSAARSILGTAAGIRGASIDDDCDAVLVGDLCLYIELYKTLSP